MGSKRSSRAAGGHFIRRDVYSLSPEGREIEVLRRGIAEMQRRSRVDARDPTGWIYQANIHGTMDSDTTPRAWNSCQHGSFFFFSWHRMYLYQLERILRAASGDPSFALPYWNYSVVGRRAVPIAYRSPASASNPLYVEQRGPGINMGASLAPSDVTFDAAFRLTNFTPQPGRRVSFGGGALRQPAHFANLYGQLELRPHNVVHGKIGGWMGDPDTAALDPIFYLHHANIDRLWKRWLDQGGGRGYPGRSGDEIAWWTSRFDFFDENGSPVQMTGEEITDTVLKLDYRYDDDPPPLPGLRFAGEAVSAARGPGAVVAIRGASRGPIELGATPVTVQVDMPRKDVSGLGRVAAAPLVETQIVLILEDVTVERNPNVSYEVYLNLPEGTPPDYQSHYYLGNLGFFVGHGHGHQHGPYTFDDAFDITANVRAMVERGEWRGAPPQVTFVMRGLVPPPGPVDPAFAAEQARLPSSPVTVGRVIITTE